MKYLVIKKKDGSVSTIRYECESASEKSITYEEEIIKELYHKNEELEQQVEELKKALIGCTGAMFHYDTVIKAAEQNYAVELLKKYGAQNHNTAQHN